MDRNLESRKTRDLVDYLKSTFPELDVSQRMDMALRMRLNGLLDDCIKGVLELSDSMDKCTTRIEAMYAPKEKPVDFMEKARRFEDVESSMGKLEDLFPNSIKQEHGDDDDSDDNTDDYNDNTSDWDEATNNEEQPPTLITDLDVLLETSYDLKELLTRMRSRVRELDSNQIARVIDRAWTLQEESERKSDLPNPTVKPDDTDDGLPF